MIDAFLFDLLLGSMAVMIAAGLQVLTGFGFSLVAIPLLLYVFPGYQAILICMILSFFTLSLQVKGSFRLARWDLIWRLLLVGFPGLLIGVMWSEKLNAGHLKAIVGATVLIYVLLQWFKLEKKKRNPGTSNHTAAETSATGISAESDPHSQTNTAPKGFYAAGLLSGLLTGVAGLPGPPVVAILVQFLPRNIFRATTVNYFFIQYAIALSLSLFVFNKHNNSEVLLTVVILILPTLIGFLLGHPLRKLVNEQNFKRLVFSLLIIVGVTSTLQIF
ncbi:sulfite exporter TauE/SafE family protein [Bacillus sp. ISL-47]|uniref:sulfite exporter TauE/SafE family protein n=1 Tax=Bacillus sp. ISL-47 TaxID=2819130 RepID=UPI001BE9D274|nr:sulfite exporter TauE/SafE family protein [Bacillus sp. ISL-47]MBT2691047.1 sulfite exporter TauE/SafE family protein [Bacillus sp. ISL-47]